MQSVATKNRIYQIVIIVSFAFLFYELTNWQEGIWVAISAIVVAGPFSTFLSYEKGRNRFFGTIAGLMIASILEYYLRFNPNQLPLIAVLVAMTLAFFAVKDYKYMVTVITVCTCLGFTYMNMPFTDFEPMNFLIARGMGVFTGILIFYTLQKFIFKNDNARLELIEETNNVINKTISCLETYIQNPTNENAFEVAAQIMAQSTDLKNYYKNSYLVFDKILPESIYCKKVLTIVNKSIKELIDDKIVNINHINLYIKLLKNKAS